MIRLICGITEKELETFESKEEAINTARNLIAKGYACYLYSKGDYIYGIRDWGKEQGYGSDWSIFTRWNSAADYYNRRIEKAIKRIYNITSHPGGKYYLGNYDGYFMKMEDGTMLCTDTLEEAIAFATPEDAQSFKEDLYFAGFRILNAIAFLETQQELEDFLETIELGNAENYSYR